MLSSCLLFWQCPFYLVFTEGIIEEFTLFFFNLSIYCSFYWRIDLSFLLFNNLLQLSSNTAAFSSKLQAYLLQHFLIFSLNCLKSQYCWLGLNKNKSSYCGQPLLASAPSAVIKLAFLHRGRPPKSPQPPCWCWNALWYLLYICLCIVFYFVLIQILLLLPWLCVLWF